MSGVFRFGNQHDPVTLRLDYATGPWELALAATADGNASGDDVYIPSPASIGDGMSITIAYARRLGEVRLTAFDEQLSPQKPIRTEWRQQQNQSQIVAIYSKATFASIGELRVQKRAINTVEFRDVPLQPDAGTSVRAFVNGQEHPSGDDKKPAKPN